jgi:hypothetical protein
MHKGLSKSTSVSCVSMQRSRNSSRMTDRRALVDGEEFFEVSVLSTAKGISDVMI